ncbi:type II toxin-antitoxin system PemK/MazF family toxin [Massiliimalia timonensis]|uniref:type II toxin-antitoxin system PemK/MazF family toxin n=1 Tax=Massiliimalia timonensis TaxID=1987501 RepID=UPI00189C7293|nr:type II toxin-antitoxin system PemK/MazF family toxin [Massiliimalia timonensis]
MNPACQRGDIYYADLGSGIGSEQVGSRPVVIIQNNIGNRYSPTVIIASISSKIDAKAKLPVHYSIGTECGLELPSIILLEQIRTIDKQRLGFYIGRLNNQQIERLDYLTSISLGLLEPPKKNLVICLCTNCADNFYLSYVLKKVNPKQKEKDICTYCGYRRGIDYEIISKRGRGNSYKC